MGKKFSKRSKKQYRILFVNQFSNKIFLTAKLAMVESKKTNYWNNWKFNRQNISGTIIKILDLGAFIIAFYNHVVGAEDAKTITNLFVGMSIKKINTHMKS